MITNSVISTKNTAESINMSRIDTLTTNDIDKMKKFNCTKTKFIIDMWT